MKIDPNTYIIAVANQKGGVGKTTTAINLAASLAASKRRVLLIDLDPQGNATMGAGVDKYALSHSIVELLLNETTLDQVLQKNDVAQFHILPANGDLTVASVALLDHPEKEQRLKNIISPIAHDYDYIVIDCPPTLNMLTLNALTAATDVLIPMQCEYFSLEGLTSLIETIEQIQSSINPTLNLHGIVRTMYDSRNRLTGDINKQLQEHFGDTLYRTVIPRNVRLAEAPSFGQPILQYDRQSTGAASYMALAGEMIRRLEDKQTFASPEAAAK